MNVGKKYEKSQSTTISQKGTLPSNNIVSLQNWMISNILLLCDCDFVFYDDSLMGESCFFSLWKTNYFQLFYFLDTGTTPSKQKRTSHQINTKRLKQKTDYENLLLLQKIQNVKSSNSVRKAFAQKNLCIFINFSWNNLYQVCKAHSYAFYTEGY